MTVYFVKSAKTGHIKIGYSGTPEVRIKNLRRDHGELYLIGLLDGDMDIESALHARFSRFNIHDGPGREWFEDCEEIREFTDLYCYKPKVLIKVGLIQSGRSRRPPLSQSLLKPKQVITVKKVSPRPESKKSIDPTEIERRKAIRVGMENARRAGKHVGRPIGSAEDDMQILNKYPMVVELIRQGVGIRKTSRIVGASINTIRKIKKILHDLEG